MIVRPYSEADFDQVRSLHAAQGLAYELPDLHSPSMLVRCVIEEHGRITHAALLRKTAETYWIFDPSESRRARLGRLMILHKEIAPTAKRMGLEDIHCWIPPSIVNVALHGTMLKLGWEKAEWVSYGRRVE